MIILIGNNIDVDTRTDIFSSISDLNCIKSDIIYVSNKKNKMYRLFDMIFTVIRHRDKAQLVIIETYSTLNFYYSLIISAICIVLNISYVTTLHGGNLEYRLNNNPFFSSLIFNNSKMNITVSKFLEHVFLKYGYATEHIPNSIEISNYRYFERHKCSPRLLYVRAFHEIYNAEMAIKVLYHLGKKYSNAHLCMVGKDRDGTRYKCEKLAKELNIFDKVNFTGFLSKEEWITLSSNYDIFINPTNFDNMPISVLEAMALGMPIVTTNAGGLKYMLEHKHNALFCNINDTEKMLQNIELLIDNRDLARMLSINSRKFAEKLSKDKVGFIWEEKISSLLNSSQT